MEALKDLEPLDMMAVRRERCLPGTRVNILRALFTSLTDPTADKNIVWLRGAAGSGKSTILNTLAHYTFQLCRQGAFLFWERSKTDNSEPHRVIHTLAHQLARFNAIFAQELETQIKTRPHVMESSLDSQFQYLLVEPLAALTAIHDFGPIFLILDALDECGISESRRQLLNTLSTKLPKVVRVLIASRDEPDIDAALSHLNPETYDTPMGDRSTSLDIKLLFEKRLATNTKVSTSGRPPPEWLGAELIQRLVALSGGLFIWASTTIRFIESGPRKDRLNKILSASAHQRSYARLDDLYMIALTHSFDSYADDELEYVHSILGAIVVAREPLTDEQLGQLLRLEIDVVQDVLSRLQPLLRGGHGRPVRFLHVSFIDFLCNLERRQPDIPNWHIVIMSTCHLDLASGCVHIMEQDLKFNICGIETSYCRNKDIEGIQKRIEQVITPALMYASRYWADHLESGSTSEADLHPFLGRVRDFFTRRFLYWIEVFSLKEQMSMIPMILRKVTDWAKVCHSPDAW